MLKKITATAGLLILASSSFAITWVDHQNPYAYINEYNGGYQGTFDITPDYKPGVHYIASAHVRFGFADDAFFGDWKYIGDVKEYVDIELDTTLLFNNEEVDGNIFFGYDWVGAGLSGSLLGSLRDNGKLDYSVTVNNLSRKKEDTWLKVAKLVAKGGIREGGGNPTKVPDSGTSLALLGLGLIGLFFARNKLRK